MVNTWREPSPEERSLWDESMGPFFAASALERNRIEPDDCIHITTEEGIRVYPYQQFVLDAYIQPIARREDVIALWQEHLLPAVESGDIDEYMAANLMLGSGKSSPSYAQEIVRADDRQAKVAEVAERLQRFVARMMQ